MTRFKALARRILCLILAFIMIMPTGVYAAPSRVTSWEEYWAVIKNAIMNQQELIEIQFDGIQINPYLIAILKLEQEYEKAKEDIPLYLGELNIKKETTLAEEGEDNTLKSAIHTVEYKLSADDFRAIRSILAEQYDNIRSKKTEYEKIKGAYDFIVLELNDTNSNLSKIFEGKDVNNPYATLFAMMMTDLGYDNDIVYGLESGRVWNIVRFQGKWYHVDVVEDQFLVPKDIDSFNKEDHKDKEGCFATEQYQAGDEPIIPELIYEIDQLIKNMKELEGQVKEISDSVMSLNEVRDVKNIFEVLDKKVENYEEIRDVIDKELDRFNDTELNNKYTELNNKYNDLKAVIENFKGEIKNKKLTILHKAVERAEYTLDLSHVLIALEALELLPLNNSDRIEIEIKILALEKALVAIERAERTKNEEDIKNAKNEIHGAENEIPDKTLKNLKARIQLLEATIAVEKAERTLAEADINEAIRLIDLIDEEDYYKKLLDRINAVIETNEARVEEQERIKKATEAVENAEEAVRKESLENIINKINIAIDLIESVKTQSIKTILMDRINRVILAKDAIIAVNKASETIKCFSDSDIDIATLIVDLEKDIDKAKDTIRNIDSDIKASLQNKLKSIELALSALKAVNKAETSKPLKISYIISARKAVEKIDEEYWELIMYLNDKLSFLESEVNIQNIVSKAIQAVTKVEKSLKQKDLAIAREEVELLKQVDVNKELNSTIKWLEDRINATSTMMELESNLNDYLERLDEESLGDLIKDVEETFNYKLDESIIIERKSRLIVLENARKAIASILAVIEEATEENIKAAEEDIANITDSKIKKILEKKLEDLVAEKELNDLIELAQNAVEEAEKVLIEANDPQNEITIGEIKAKVDEANGLVKKLPSGSDKSVLQNIIKDLNKAIKSIETVERILSKGENITEKDLRTAENAFKDIKGEYIAGYRTKIEEIRRQLNENRAKERLNKAIQALDKAKLTRLIKDVSSAWKAIDALDGSEELEDNSGNIINKGSLSDQLKELEIDIAEGAVKKAENSALYNSNSLSKDVKDAEKIVEEIKNSDEKVKLNARIKALNMYQDLLKALEKAEKSKTGEDIVATRAILTLFEDLVDEISGERADEAEDGEEVEEGGTEEVEEDSQDQDRSIYDKLIEQVNGRILKLEEYLEGVKENEAEAIALVEGLENILLENKDENPSATAILEAKMAVEQLIDKRLKTELRKRIAAVEDVIDAKLAVLRAQSYVNEKNVKDAEKALNKVDSKYVEIIQDLSEKIADLKAQLDIEKTVEEATKLLEKAIKSRSVTDLARARIAIDALKTIDPQAAEGLEEILEELEDSIENEAENKKAAAEKAREYIDDAFTEIWNIQEAIKLIVEGSEAEEAEIKEAYDKIRLVRTQLIMAEAEVNKLTDKKDLLAEITYARKELDKVEDEVDVREAFRLLNLAFSLVHEAEDDMGKREARWAITVARKAIDRINHPDNKDHKRTITNALNAIEKKLETDDDQELIDLAIEEVNKVADLLAKAVREGKVVELRQDIEKAIFAANLAINKISDNNKVAKETLREFLQDIEDAFNLELAGIENEERIRLAEEAVRQAEENKDNEEELEKLIRIARLRVKLIDEKIPEHKAKKDELNLRLDVLERNLGGRPGSGGSGSDGGGSGGKGSGKDKTPTTPIPDELRVIETYPIWGKTKELKDSNPTQGLSQREIEQLIKAESQENLIQASKAIKNTKNPVIKLQMAGKITNLTSDNFIHNRESDRILLPVDLLSRGLGFAANITDSELVKGSKKLEIRALVDGKVRSITKDIGRGFAFVDGRARSVSKSRFAIRQGVVYIPLDFLIEHLNIGFSYTKTNNTIQIILN